MISHSGDVFDEPHGHVGGGEGQVAAGLDADVAQEVRVAAVRGVM